MSKNNRCVVRCENIGDEITVVAGTTLRELIQYLPESEKESYIAAYVNNKSKDLNYVINTNITVRFITPSHFEGTRVYRRTLIFMLSKALRELYPDVKLNVQFSVGLGAYFELEGAEEDVDISHELKSKIKEYIAQDIDIECETLHADELRDIFVKSGENDKLELMESLRYLYYTVNRLDGITGYRYSPLAASTGYISIFDIEKFYNGYLIVMPSRNNLNQLEPLPKSRKIHEVFSIYKRWMSILDVSTIGQLNQKIQRGEAADLVKIGEALHEKNMSNLADMIYEKYNNGVRVVMLSGPSSSGKTTSSYRLSVQLRVMGLEPVIIGMDNYFVNRVDTPLDEKGRYDYERLESIDVLLLNQQINELIMGNEVEIPHYNFVKGEREYIGNVLKLKSNSVLVIEGIHALNPEATSAIDRDKIFKIYVSALTSISLDNMSYVSTTDNRLLRRMVRDNQFRGSSALETLKRWGSVRNGEEKYIFPFQNEADFQFNSALFYEIGVLKHYAEPLLMGVPRDTEEYGEAKRLCNLLEFFTPIPASLVPSSSLLKEFIGGSSFDIK